MSQFQTVAKVGDVTEGDSTVVTHAGRPVALFLLGGTYYAIDDRCPHAGASLAGGHVEDGTVTCPWHAWRFRLSDGVWVDNPRIKTGCYAVEVVGDEIRLQMPSDSDELGGASCGE